MFWWFSYFVVLVIVVRLARFLFWFWFGCLETWSLCLGSRASQFSQVAWLASLRNLLCPPPTQCWNCKHTSLHSAFFFKPVVQMKVKHSTHWAISPIPYLVILLETTLYFLLLSALADIWGSAWFLLLSRSPIHTSCSSSQFSNLPSSILFFPSLQIGAYLCLCFSHLFLGAQFPTGSQDVFCLFIWFFSFIVAVV